MIVLYDYVVTFDREVALFWRRRFNAATVLFFLTRYVFLAYTIFTLSPTGLTDQVSQGDPCYLETGGMS